MLVDTNHVKVFNVRQDPGERDDLTNTRQDIARQLRPLLAAWEMDVNAEQRVNEPEQAERLQPAPARQGGAGAAGGRGGAGGAGGGGHGGRQGGADDNN